MTGIVQDEIFEMDELAVDPEGSAGIGEMASFEETAADLGSGDALVETGECGSSLGDRLEQALDGKFREIVRH